MGQLSREHITRAGEAMKLATDKAVKGDQQYKREVISKAGRNRIKGAAEDGYYKYE